MEYDNTNTGAIFKNEDKVTKKEEGTDTSKWADYQGKFNIEGVEYYASMWLREIQKGDNKGKKFFSVALKPVNEGASTSKAKNDVEELDDLPF